MLEDKIDAFCQKAIDTAEKEAIIIGIKSLFRTYHWSYRLLFCFKSTLNTNHYSYSSQCI